MWPLEAIAAPSSATDFTKDPQRWAATPRYRLRSIMQLEQKIEAESRIRENPSRLREPGSARSERLFRSGVAAANTRELLEELGLWDKISFYQVAQPFPLHTRFMREVLSTHEEILVIEETTGVIEMQLARRDWVRGKLDGTVPRVGELLPETIERLLRTFAGLTCADPSPAGKTPRRPTLCAGCPHRASFLCHPPRPPPKAFLPATSAAIRSG